jgi:hypothetical protein
VLDLEPSSILSREKRKLKNEEKLTNIKKQVKDIIDVELTKSNRYLLATIFKNRPG